MRTQEKLMRDAGYVTATTAADAVGADNIGTIHRMVKSGKLVGAKIAAHWYISVKSLLEVYAQAPPILARLRAMGVEAKDITVEATVERFPIKAAPKGKAKARRAS